MGRYCKVCGNSRPNERFGGRGMRRFICSACRKLPKEQQRRRLWTDEVLGFLEQSNISAKNIKRLREIEQAGTQPVDALAALVRQIAEVKPHKKRRWKWLRANHPELLEKARQLGLLHDLPPEQLFDETEFVNAELDWAAADDSGLSETGDIPL